MKKRVRIIDIAERAGVSPGTVDRVIHGRGNVSKKVEERIRRVMRELDYQPNRIASTLALNRTYRIATLLPDFRVDPYWDQPRKGVESAFRQVRHYNFVWEAHYFELHQPDDFRLKADAILRDAPDALLVAPVFLRAGIQLLEQCRQRQIPVVKINTDIEEDYSLCYVGQNSYQSGVLAGKLLHFFVQPGDTVMVLNLDQESHSAQHLMDKEQGIRDYFKRLPAFDITVVQEEFIQYDQPKLLREFLFHQLTAHSRLAGIFVTNSRAYRLLDCLKEELPVHLRIVGFDLLEENLRYLRQNRIAFLINQNPLQQGYRGIINLFNHLVLKEKVERRQYLPLDIVVTENVEYYLQPERELQLVV